MSPQSISDYSAERMNLLLLHGLGRDEKSWDGVVSLLPEEWSIERPALRDLMDEGFTYEALYKNLRDTVEERGAPTAVCGLSLGAVLALNLSFDAPALVSSLILIAPQFQMPKGTLKLQSLLFRLMPNRAFEEIGLPKKGMIALTDSMARLDFTDRLDRVKCPALILCGERDRVNKKAAERLGDRLQNSESALVPGAGHEANLDNPRALAELILQTLSSRTYD
ncbi:MAG: alpha/beta hydrolase [Bacteroides sp.]|nr:alpha/beta hydrolase [Eubacterium sp.]MCM1417780.1 alpha/beta hydrolase [Roseburia sp.]MCM1461329.1 alpha/beta hydrolase [Bacteroides sp.]